MELPLDHFRLLGISPSFGYDRVLQALKHRLDTPPEDGYSSATIDARAELLRISAGLLSDPQRRHQYEQTLTNFQDAGGDRIPTIDIPSPLHVGGLLLLLEAKQPFEAFEAAVDLLQENKVNVVDPGDKADLGLLACVAARTAAWDVWNQRLYEQAADILRKALHILESESSQLSWQEHLQNDLIKLRPYRILDLLSRDLASAQARQQGLELLRELIEERGGLEAEDDPHMSAADFQNFLKQIRTYMTVSEQLDLYEGWSSRGSTSAEFLCAYAMAASGFQQRKPERIRQALDRITAMPVQGLEPEQACLLLLLGRTGEAQGRIRSCSDPELSRWLAAHATDPLAGLCAFCRDWLGKQVLPGYRGMDPVVDLDAYFVDSDVQNYIEAEDQRRLFKAESDESGESAPSHKQEQVAVELPNANVVGRDFPGSFPFEPHALESVPPEPAVPSLAPSPDQVPHRDKPSAPVAGRAGRRRKTLRSRSLPGGIIIAALVGGGLWIWGSSRQPVPLASGSGPQAGEPAPPDQPEVPPSPLQVAQAAEVLDKTAIAILLEAWLQLKAEVLSGSAESGEIDAERLGRITQLATPAQAEAVRYQRQQLYRGNQRLQVSATPRNIAVLKQRPDQITARVSLEYAEETIDAEGTTTDRLGPLRMSNDYVFSRTAAGWKLHGFTGSR